MFDIIVAMTKNGGIGLDGGMAWHCKEELRLFKKKTMGSILVMGRKTVENLPHLAGRKIWVVTRNENLDTSEYKNEVKVFTNLSHLWREISYARRVQGKKIFCAGGAKFYQRMGSPRWCMAIDYYHISIMKKEYKCDTFFELSKLITADWLIVEKQNYDEFTHYVYKIQNPRHTTQELRYISLLREVLENGQVRQGRNGETKSMFYKNLSFDLRKGFPLITTKRMFWRGIVEELLFFLRGETDSKKLESKGVNIWKGNTERKFLDANGFQDRKEGMMGAMYGFQLRHFNGDYDETTGGVQQTRFELPNFGVDQLKNVINKIKNDPHSRRILMTTYNPAQSHLGVLYPCHGLFIQFYVDGNFLDCFAVSRSGDLFLGIPFNIASYSLLLSIIANTTSKIPRMLHLSIGDAHIYKEHYDAAKRQIGRLPFVLPTLEINRELQDVEDIESLIFDDFVLQDYEYHPSIKASMIA